MFKKFFAVGFVLAASVATVMAAGTDTGLVQDNLGANVVGATVTYTRGANTWQATTDANGVYRFSLGFTASLNVINAAAGAGSAGTIVASKTGYVNSAAGATLTITVADTTGGIVIGNATRVITIRTTFGNVYDSATSVSLVGAKIQLKRAGTIIDSTVTSGAGTYTLSRVATGDTLVASTASYYVKSARDVLAAATVRDTINFALSGFGSIAGKVTDSATSAALNGATVTLARVIGGVVQPVMATTNANAQGLYSFDTILARVAYQIAASATGYASQAKQISPKSIGMDSANFLLLAVRTVTGTVTDSSTLAVVSGASVLLKDSSTIIDSATTNASGVYTMSGAYLPGTHTLAVSKVHYITKSGSLQIPASPMTVTQNVFIYPALGSITGTITADSAAGQLLAGAKVVLAKVISGNPVTIDSTVTNGSGVYTFVKDTAGYSYTISASANGYIPTTVTLVNKAVGTDVFNVILLDGSSKTLSVKVISRTTGNPLVGASVGFTKGTLVVGGITNAAGVLTIASAPFGFDTVTAADTLYIAQQTTFILNAHFLDTLFDTLTQVATGTTQRAIRGTAHTGTLTGPVAVGAQIVFKTAGGYVFSATTLANGTWSVIGIPTAIGATGSIPIYSATTGLGIRATLTGWAPFMNTAAVNIAATGTTTYNNVLFTVPSSVLPQIAEKTAGAPEFNVLHSGIITLKNMTEPGMVKVFNLGGQMLYNHAFEANTASLHVQALTQGKTAYIVSITQNKAEYKKVVLMP